MTRLLRFRDLKERQIVTSWPQLRRMVRDYGFPTGLLLGPNSRAWPEVEVEQWLASRPTAPKPDPRKAMAHNPADHPSEQFSEKRNRRVVRSGRKDSRGTREFSPVGLHAQPSGSRSR